MDQYQNPSFEVGNSSQVPNINPGLPQNFENSSTPTGEVPSQPVTSQQGGEEVLRVWDINNQQRQQVESASQETQQEQNLPPQQPTYTDPVIPGTEPITPQIEETPETDNPINFIRQETPSNDEYVSAQEPRIQQNISAPEEPEFTPVPETTTLKSEFVETDNKEPLEKKLDSLKDLIVAILDDQKVKDLADYPSELLNPEVFGSSSGRKMIKPFDIQTVRFGYTEFKKALENPMFLDDNTYILKYLSERPRDDGSTPEPRYLKCTKEQVDRWKEFVQETDQSNNTQLQEQPR